MNFRIITGWDFSYKDHLSLRIMVLCQKHLKEWAGMVEHNGTTEDSCFQCDKEWYERFLDKLKKQLWLEDIKPTDAVYISGPMTGLPDLNRPAFHLMEYILRQTGCTILSPARYLPGEENLSHQEYMERDIKMVLDSDKMVVLNGAENSIGAGVEMTVAKSIGCVIYHEF